MRRARRESVVAAFISTDCAAAANAVSYEPAGGRLRIPALEVIDNRKQTLGFVQAELQQVADSRAGVWFEVVSAVGLDSWPAWVQGRYNADTGVAGLNGYLRGPEGESFHRARFELDQEPPRILVTGLDTLPPPASAVPVYQGDENVFPLLRGGANQFLLPVQVGGQTFNLLVDTGSDALLIFEDRLNPCNRGQAGGIHTDLTPVTKSYAGTTREGVVAAAPVRIGAYTHPAMRIMLVTLPHSRDDASLTAKGADGIIGLRRTGGLNAGSGAGLLDAPLNVLSPLVGGMESNLPPAGEATLSFGVKPILDHSAENLIFRAKALSVAAPSRQDFSKSFADMQIPFRAKTAYGEAAREGLDILLDTGAVSRLVLDTRVAEQLGYDVARGKWRLDENEDIELNFIGVTPRPNSKSMKSASRPTAPWAWNSRRGINRRQEYVMGFDCVSQRQRCLPRHSNGSG